MADIFISYKHEEQQIAKKLADALQKKGWTVWWDPEVLTGERFHDIIDTELKESKCVVVLWSKLSVESENVKDEATYALKRKKLVPITIEDVDLPYWAERINTGQLINWDGSDNFPGYQKLVSDITKIIAEEDKRRRKEAERKAENERRRKQEQERKLREEEQRKAKEERQRLEEEKQRLAEQKRKFEGEQKRLEAARKAEEEHKQKEAEAKRKADEEKRRKEKEELKRKSEREERKRKLAEEERKRREAERKAEEERKKTEIKARHREKEKKTKPDKPDPAKVKLAEPKPDATAAIEPKSPEPSKKSNALKIGVVACVIMLLIAGIWWWVSQQQVKEVRQNIEKLNRQTLNLENAIVELNQPEQINEFTSQRDTLNSQIDNLSEQATKVGLESPFSELQDRLKQVQIQLANKEKELIAARRGKIFVESVPDDATVKILNIDQGFRQGMELEPGKYHVHVSSERYEPQDRWIELGAGEEKQINFELEKIAPKDTSKQSKATTTKDDTPPTQSLFGRYHGLLIGNNDYKYPHKLKTPINDVNAIGDLLRSKYGFRVRLLTNSTRSDIFRAISEYRQMLPIKDNLLIYYAGHCSIDKETESAYWLPVDAEREHKTNWIATEELTKELKAMAAKHILIVGDSCFSGILPRRSYLSLTKTGDQKKEWIIQMAQRRSRTVLTSGGLEPVPDEGSGGHSVFANAFLSALKENNEIIDMDSLYDSITRQVGLNARQTPLYSDIRFTDHDDGDFIFVPNLKRK